MLDFVMVLLMACHDGLKGWIPDSPQSFI